MEKLLHKNISESVAFFDDSFRYQNYMVLEHYDNLNLKQLLKKEGLMNEKQGARMVKQILNAFVYLKQKRVIHRDVHLENIMISESKCL